MPEIPEKNVPRLRAQLRRITAAAEHTPLWAERRLQDLMAGVMQKSVRLPIREERLSPGPFEAALLTPEGPALPGAVLYLHGGGYCCGDLEYAKWFGKVLAEHTGARVLCPAYRLAPEHPFPAAPEDALAAFDALAALCPPEKIVVAGESAGGGLLFSLCALLRRQARPLPGGLVAISPWTDLTLSGASYEENRAADPSMTGPRLARFAALYTQTPADPLCSPLFGDVRGFPDTLLFVGGDEIMRDDAAAMQEKLTAAGVNSRLTVAPGLWHAYPFYGLRERRGDLDAMAAFIKEKIV